MKSIADTFTQDTKDFIKSSDHIYLRVVLKPPKEGLTPFRFEVYRFSDIERFLKMLDRENAMLIYVVALDNSPLLEGYGITYWHTEELSMEILC